MPISLTVWSTKQRIKLNGEVSPGKLLRRTDGPLLDVSKVPATVRATGGRKRKNPQNLQTG